MYKEPPESEKELSNDLKICEELPAKTKELVKLKGQAEKTTGQESAAIHGNIRDQSSCET